MKNKLKILLNILSLGILISSFKGIFLSKDYIFSNRYLYYKMYRFIGQGLQESLNKAIIPIAIWIICLFLSLSISIFLIKKLAKPLIQNIIKINIQDKNELIRLYFSTAICLFFLIYDGWMINVWIIPNGNLMLRILVNSIILPISVLLWLLFIQARWEKFWELVLKIKNPCWKLLNIIAIILVTFLILLNISIHIDKRINKAKERPNIILISIDTLRADHLGCYGYEKNITPNIDMFSEDAIIFKNCIAQAPYTTASHASMFTSLIPTHHGLLDGKFLDNVDVISEDVLTLGEIAKNYYYETASFNGGGTVSAFFGFGRGFNIYNEVGGNFDEVIEPAQEWIKNNKNDIFLLFLHTFELHDPYSPSSEYLSKIEKDYKGDFPDDMSRIEYFDKINEGEIIINDDDLNHIVNLYDAEIMSMDAAFYSLIEFLKEEGVYDNSIIIFTSDHGEEFNDHGMVGRHGHTLYDELLRVPLVIKFPDSRFKGRVIYDQVRGIDILPTLLDWLKIDKPVYFEGESFIPLLKKDVAREEKYSISQGKEYSSEIFSVQGEIFSGIRTNKWKWYNRMLFDLENDPEEKLDVAEKYTKVVEFLESRLNEVVNLNKLGDTEGKEKEFLEMDEKLKEQLRSLGYLQ